MKTLTINKTVSRALQRNYSSAVHIRIISDHIGRFFYFRGMVLQFCVYVLFSLKDEKLYIGYSTNLPNRLQDYNKGSVLSTKGRRPLELIYSEFHSNKYDALRREKYFKTTSGKKGLKLMLREKLATLKTS